MSREIRLDADSANIKSNPWWFAPVAVLLSLCGCAFLLEILFRFVPAFLPTGYYRNAMRYDSDLELFVSDGPVVYNKVRFTVRHSNPDGFMDVSHKKEKAPGKYRIGFFGDSFVESLQVPLEQVFFRRLENRAWDRDIEMFAYGQGGWGTLEAIRTHSKYGDIYNLDAVVYLFVENDPGNNHFLIENGRPGVFHSSRCAAMPVDEQGDYRTLCPGPPNTASLGRQAGRILKRYSVLAQVVEFRVQLLLKKMSRPSQADRGKSPSSTIPGPSDPPSHWPPEIRKEAWKLTEVMLDELRQAVLEAGRKFVIFYVPLAAHLAGNREEIDTWKPYLLRYVEESGVPLLDPGSAFLKKMEAGIPMNDDHWTPEGHKAVADVLARWMEEQLSLSVANKRGLPL